MNWIVPVLNQNPEIYQDPPTWDQDDLVLLMLKLKTLKVLAFNVHRGKHRISTATIPLKIQLHHHNSSLVRY